MAINGWTLAQAEHTKDEAMTQWEERSRHKWKSDYSWVTRTHGFVLDKASAARAETANLELIAVARQGAEEAEQSYVDAILKARPRPASGPERNPKRSVIGMLKSLFR